MTRKGAKQVNMVSRQGTGLFLTAFARFEDSYMPEPNTGCWLWTRYTNKGGYGMLGIKGKAELANRLSYRFFKGDPIGQSVLHTCDVRSCVNPDHLYLGDIKQNMKDRDSRGRVQRGQTHFRAKLTEIDIQIIREAISLGFTNVSIGKYFKVKGHTISGIKFRKTWKHI